MGIPRDKRQDGYKDLMHHLQCCRLFQLNAQMSRNVYWELNAVNPTQIYCPIEYDYKHRIQSNTFTKLEVYF